VTRTLSELIDKHDPSWPLLQEWIGESTHSVEVLPAERLRAERVLLAVQVTTRSMLGTIAFKTGGLLIDAGWVRILGSGGTPMEGDLALWNGLGAAAWRPTVPGLFIVGYDALGGFFALNGGALGKNVGGAFYFAPDSLEWEDLERGYADLVHFLITGDLQRFYANYRWPGWERDVASLHADQGFSVTPPLWTKEGKDLLAQLRRPAPMTEIFDLQMSMREQLAAR
jgi:hypothetical protein